MHSSSNLSPHKALLVDLWKDDQRLVRPRKASWKAMHPEVAQRLKASWGITNPLLRHSQATWEHTFFSRYKACRCLPFSLEETRCPVVPAILGLSVSTPLWRHSNPLHLLGGNARADLYLCETLRCGCNAISQYSHYVSWLHIDPPHVSLGAQS